MASSTIGRLYGGDYAVNKLRVAAAPISGAGQNRLFDTGDFPLVVNGNWQRWNALAISGQVTIAAGMAPIAALLVPHNGDYTLAGQTQLGGVPYPAWVLVYPEEAPALCVRSMVTDATGNFEFVGLAAGRYTVLGIDLNDVYNGVVYCMVVAIP